MKSFKFAKSSILNGRRWFSREVKSRSILFFSKKIRQSARPAASAERGVSDDQRCGEECSRGVEQFTNKARPDEQLNEADAQ